MFKTKFATWGFFVGGIAIFTSANPAEVIAYAESWLSDNKDHVCEYHVNLIQ